MSKRTPSHKKHQRRRSNTVPTSPSPDEVISELVVALISAGCPGDVVAMLRPRLLDLMERAERRSETTARAIVVASRALSKVTFLLGILESIDAEHPAIVRRHFKRYRAALN